MKKSQYALFRENLNLPLELPKELSFKVATTESEYHEAMQILYECYVEKGYTQENDEKIRLTPYHLMPTTTVIVTLWNNQIIGTISLIRDNPMGLPVDKIFDLSYLRKNNQVLCEVSSLAIKKSHRGKSGEIFHPLVRYMWNYAHQYFGVDYFVIAVNPSMYELYESIYLFRPLSRTNHKSQYEFANNNPAVGEYINVKKSYAAFERQYQKCCPQKNLYRFIKSQSLTNEHFPRREYYTHIDAPVTPIWLKRFKKYLPKDENTDQTLNQIAKTYGFKDHSVMSQRSLHEGFRLPVSFEVLNHPNCQIKDISQGGIRVISSIPLDKIKHIILDCKLSHDKTAQIVAKPIWNKDLINSETAPIELKTKLRSPFQQILGLKVVESSLSWQNMLEQTLKPLLNK